MAQQIYAVVALFYTNKPIISGFSFKYWLWSFDLVGCDSDFQSTVRKLKHDSNNLLKGSKPILSKEVSVCDILKRKLRPNLAFKVNSIVINESIN